MIRAARVNSDTASQKRSLEKRRQRRKNSACYETLLTLLCRSSLVLRPSGKYSRIRTYVRHELLRKVPKIAPERATVFTPSKTNNELRPAANIERDHLPKTNATKRVKITSQRRSRRYSCVYLSVSGPNRPDYRVRGTACVPLGPTPDPCKRNRTADRQTARKILLTSW